MAPPLSKAHQARKVDRAISALSNLAVWLRGMRLTASRKIRLAELEEAAADLREVRLALLNEAEK